jgi:hypothetical protein
MVYRSIPLGFQLRHRLGNWKIQTLWYTFGVVLYLCLFFVRHTDWSSFYTHAYTHQTTATITARYRTRASRPVAPNMPDRRLLAFEYTFDFEDKWPVRGISFGYDLELKPGDFIPVLYNQAHPEQNIIVGMQKSFYKPETLLAWVYPLFLWVFLYKYNREKTAELIVYRHGLIAQGFQWYRITGSKMFLELFHERAIWKNPLESWEQKGISEADLFLFLPNHRRFIHSGQFPRRLSSVDDEKLWYERKFTDYLFVFAPIAPLASLTHGILRWLGI